MKKTTATLLASLTLALGLHAAPLAFDFKDPKGINHARFTLDAPLEAISGLGTGIGGTVNFDPAKPAATSGKIVLQTASLATSNPVQTEHLHSAGWLDATRHPEISFTAEKLTDVKTQDNKTTANVTGTLLIKGVSKTITAPVSLTYLPGQVGERLGNPDAKGDLLVLRTEFSIKRSDFGIQPGQTLSKVAENITLSLSIAGATAAQ